jgi:hypothetical protein
MEAKIQKILNHVRECGGVHSEWYCGIAANAKDRLFNEHKVLEKGGSWIYSNFGESDMARNVEKYFLDKLGFDGGSGGGDYSTAYVYVYKKTSYTIE